jgi:flagellar biogenesis protein FliO
VTQWSGTNARGVRPGERWRACACALVLLLSFASATSAAPATQPANTRTRAASEKRSAVAAAAAPTTQAAVPLPPAKPSLLDAESIKRHAGTPAGASTRPAGTQPSVASPQPFEFQRVVLALGAVIALIFVLRWVAKRVFVMPGAARASRAVQVLSRSPLAPRQQVLLLQVGRRVVVVADSGGTMSTLCQIEDPDEVTSLLAQIMADRGMSSPKAFGSVFGRTRNRFDESMEEGEGITSALEGADPVEAPDDPAANETSSEIRGLMNRVRQMSSQFRAGRGDA